MPTTKQIDFTKPFQVMSNSEQYICSHDKLNPQFCIIKHIGRGEIYTYAKATVESLIKKGDWKILTNENTEVAGNSQEDAMKKLEDYIRAIHKSVPREDTTEESFKSVKGPCYFCEGRISNCDCGEFIEVPEQDVLVPCKDDGYESLLDSIKYFTQNTASTVFMVDGKYEVYCLGLDSPFKAATDAEMWKLIESVEMLEGAM